MGGVRPGCHPAVAPDTRSHCHGSTDGFLRRGPTDGDAAGNDLAAYQMVFFMADVFVGLLLLPPADAVERRRAQRTMERYVEYATKPVYRHHDAFGDALTTCSRPMYSSPVLSLRFARAGGISLMFEDWVCVFASFCL